MTTTRACRPNAKQTRKVGDDRLQPRRYTNGSKQILLARPEPHLSSRVDVPRANLRFQSLSRRRHFQRRACATRSNARLRGESSRLEKRRPCDRPWLFPKCGAFAWIWKRSSIDREAAVTMISWTTRVRMVADVVGEILTQKIKLRKLGDVDAIGEDMAGKTCIITGPTRCEEAMRSERIGD